MKKYINGKNLIILIGIIILVVVIVAVVNKSV